MASSQLNRLSVFQNLSAKKDMLRSLVGVVQFGATDNWDHNYQKVAQYTKEATDRGADMVCLPEHFAFNDNHNADDKIMKDCDDNAPVFLKKYQ